MSIEKLREPLTVDDIEFRIQSIVGATKKYAIILAYKDARVDMKRLDEAVGSLNWQREHYQVGNHLHCKVSIYNEKTGQWVSKSDVGTESNTEATKGEASDSFKRACFNWGIGRELYGYPLIMVQLTDAEFRMNGNRAQATNKLRPMNWHWELESASDGTVLFLKATDKHGVVRFNYKTQPFISDPQQVAKPSEYATAEQVQIIENYRNMGDAQADYIAGKLEQNGVGSISELSLESADKICKAIEKAKKKAEQTNPGIQQNARSS